MERARSLANGWSTVGGTGLDSSNDNYEQTQEKFAIVSAALDIRLEVGESQQTTNAARSHLIRLEEAVKGALD